MATVSEALFWLGGMLTATAVILQLWSILGARVIRRAAVTNAGTITLTEQEPPSPVWGRLGSAFAVMAAAALVLMLITRTIATREPPYSNMFEYLTAFGAGVVVAAVVLERRTGQRVISAFALPAAMALLLTAQIAFSSEIEPLVPALQNKRLLGVHVASMLTSYSIIAVAGVAAVLYLVQGEHNRFARLPRAEVLSDLTYKAVVAGFPILGLGIALGAYWGNIAWGRYWGWDPKETTALVSWLVLAGYLHAHSLSRWRGTRAAWLVVIALGSIVFNIFVVNFVIAGLHSYA
jgi:cytochrome c-type biogenesis protein CcsB